MVVALWGIAARQSNEMGLRLLVQFAETVGLDPVVHTPSKPSAAYRRLTAYTVPSDTSRACPVLDTGAAAIWGTVQPSSILIRMRARVTMRAACLPPRINRFSCSRSSVVNRMVYRVKRRYGAAGLDGVLQDRVQANRFRKLDDKAEAHLIAPACSPAPEGHDHWTLSATGGLADRMVELGLVESLSYETVRLKLKKTSSSPGASNSGAFPRSAGSL